MLQNKNLNIVQRIYTKKMAEPLKSNVTMRFFTKVIPSMSRNTKKKLTKIVLGERLFLATIS